MPKKGQESAVPRDLERAGSLCLALANTAVPWRDERRKDAPLVPELRTYREAVAWSRRMGVLGAEAAEWLLREAAERPADAKRALAGIHALRAAIRRLATGVLLGDEPRPEDLEALNAGLAARRFVHGPDGFGWAAAADPRALDRMLGPIAQSAADLLTSPGELERLRQCAAEGCTRLFLYQTSRRRWCDMNRCGNRAKGRRHYERNRRKRGGPDPFLVERVLRSAEPYRDP